LEKPTSFYVKSVLRWVL